METFTTESGMRYTWTASQIAAYKEARAAGTDEREAIDAANGERPTADATAPDAIDGPLTVYARRERVYATAARGQSRPATRVTEEPVDVLPDPAEVYARRERVHQGRPR